MDYFTGVHSAVGKSQTLSAPFVLSICNAASIKQSTSNKLLAADNFSPFTLFSKEQVSHSPEAGVAQQFQCSQCRHRGKPDFQR